MSNFAEDFIADLETYATGSYLRDNEKEHWTQPYDPSVLPQLKALISAFSNKVVMDPDAAVVAAADFIQKVNDFNHAHGYAVIEHEEENELQGFIRSTLYSAGVEDEALKTLPEFE